MRRGRWGGWTGRRGWGEGDGMEGNREGETGKGQWGGGDGKGGNREGEMGRERQGVGKGRQGGVKRRGNFMDGYDGMPRWA